MSGRAACWALGTVGPGSAGASTLAVALATQVEGLVVEADADGGVIGARYGGWLNEQAPSLASLLAAVQTKTDSESVQDHFQRLPGGARAVLVPPDAEGALGPVRRLAEDLGRVRERLAGEVMVLDIGRVRPDSPSTVLAERADVLVAVVKPQVESLGCLLARIPVLVEQASRMVIAVRGEGAYSLADIRAAVQMTTNARVPVVPVPHDPRGVAALHQSHSRSVGPWRPGAGRVTALTRSADALVTIVSSLAPGHSGPLLATRDGSGGASFPLEISLDSNRSRRSRTAP